MAFENLKSTGLTYLLTRLKEHFLQIKDAVKTVNGEEPDENGDILIESVPYAQNLESETSHRNVDSFIQRTTGGTGSVENGGSWLMNIKGNYIHNGFVPESINMTVTAVERENPITATLDRETFVDYVSESGTIILTYTNTWSASPVDYGITVTGTAVSGDVITIVYVKEERGTITQSNPQSFVSTGWNLYSHANTYAKVVKYSKGYKVGGTYTALQYSATVSGEKTSIVVSNNNFDVPADGYVWVTGGNGTDTAIYPTWDDWSDGHPGEWEGYSASVVDLSGVMSSYFPYGLLAVGSVQDEIDLNLGQAYSRVQRMEYSAENLATAAESGREYEYDEDYIYLAKATVTPVQIAVDNSVSADDHGIEYFTGTNVGVNAEILYGNNLKNKLERDVLTISQQTLTDEQKTQVRTNIGATGFSDFIVQGVLVELIWDSLTDQHCAKSVTPTPITGYKPFGIIGWQMMYTLSSQNDKKDRVNLSSLYYDSSTNKVYVEARTTEQLSITTVGGYRVGVKMLYMKNM